MMLILLIVFIHQKHLVYKKKVDIWIFFLMVDKVVQEDVKN